MYGKLQCAQDIGPSAVAVCPELLPQGSEPWPPRLMGRGRLKNRPQKTSISIQRIISPYRCIWSHNDTRIAATQKVNAIGEEMEPANDAVCQQPAEDHLTPFFSGHSNLQGVASPLFTRLFPALGVL